MDSVLITLLVIVIAAISNWLQHRAQAQQEEPVDPAHPRPQTPPRPRPLIQKVPGPVAPEVILERELRRLLGGEPSSPPVEPRKRPVVATPTPPVIVKPAVTISKRAMPAEPGPTATGSLAGDRFRESQAGFDRAQHLHESVALRLRQVDERTEKHGVSLVTAPKAGSDSPARKNARMAFDRVALRQAFVTSLIFGPPKSEELRQDQ